MVVKHLKASLSYQGRKEKTQREHLMGCLGWLKAARIKLQRGRQRGSGRGFLNLVMYLFPTCDTYFTSLHALSPNPAGRKPLASKS